MTENSLPRLGSTQAGEAKPKTKEVAIPDRGVTILLRKPSVQMILDAQAAISPTGPGQDGVDIKEGYASTVQLVSKMLVEPKMSEEALKVEVDDWSFADWQVLQTAALELAGLGEGVAEKTRAQFQS